MFAVLVALVLLVAGVAQSCTSVEQAEEAPLRAAEVSDQGKGSA
jgi:hypothetical protein